MCAIRAVLARKLRLLTGGFYKWRMVTQKLRASSPPVSAALWTGIVGLSVAKRNPYNDAARENLLRLRLMKRGKPTVGRC